MTKKAKKAISITMLVVILVGIGFCVAALAVSSSNGTTFSETVTTWWGVVVKAFNSNGNGGNSTTADKPQNEAPSDEEKPSDNQDNQEDKDSEGPTEEAGVSVCYDDNGNLLKSGVKYAFQSSLNFAEASASASDGITMTATIIPASALDKRINWTVEWVDSSSEWASGKTVTDYVTVTADSSDSRVATVNCLAPFGSQIKVVATSVANPSAKSYCTVDYLSKGEKIEISMTINYYAGDTKVFSEQVQNKDGIMIMEYKELTADITAVDYDLTFTDKSVFTKNTFVTYDFSNPTVSASSGLNQAILNYKKENGVSVTFRCDRYDNRSFIRKSTDSITSTGWNASFMQNWGLSIDSKNFGAWFAKNSLSAPDFNATMKSYSPYANFVKCLQVNPDNYDFSYIYKATDIYGNINVVKTRVKFGTSFYPTVESVDLSETAIEY